MPTRKRDAGQNPGATKIPLPLRAGSKKLFGNEHESMQALKHTSADAVTQKMATNLRHMLPICYANTCTQRPQKYINYIPPNGTYLHVYIQIFKVFN